MLKAAVCVVQTGPARAGLRVIAQERGHLAKRVIHDLGVRVEKKHEIRVRVVFAVVGCGARAPFCFRAESQLAQRQIVGARKAQIVG